jgi:hypothetical protein
LVYKSVSPWPSDEGLNKMGMKTTALCQVMPIHWLEAISQVRYRRSCSLLGLLMTPIAVAAGAVAAWRFGVDAGWTSAFFIARGFLSHWQVWCAFAMSAEAGAYLLSRADPLG